MTDTLATDPLRELVLPRLDAVRKSGGGFMARCPAHDDGKASLSVSTGREQPVVLHCQAGCSPDDVLAKLGLDWPDLSAPRVGPAVVAEYRYVDEAGDLLFVVERRFPKEFRQKRPDGQGGWAWKTSGVRRVLYRLPEVLEAVRDGRMVWLVEGEKDADRLAALGIVATCNPGGAGKWRPEYTETLAGAVVSIVADNDEPGLRHARHVADELRASGCEVTLYRAATGKDASDHLDAGHDLHELAELADEEAFPVPDTRGEERGNAPYLDVGALLDGGLPDPPAPVLLRRTDGHALFYARQVNLIFGDPESGKTLVAQAACAEALKDGRKVYFIDIDHNGPHATISRFLDMDVPEASLRDPALFRYVEPEDREHLMAVIKDAKEWQPAVAVVDSIGELLPLLGLNSNSPDDFTLAHTAVLKPLAHAGAAVLAIDHLPKNTESRAAGPTGTAAKRRAVGGVAIRVTINEQFTPGRGGSAWLSVNKDRHGGLRRNCLAEGKEPSAGLFKLDSSDGIRWTVTAPQLGDAAAAAGVDADDLTALDALDPPPSSVRDVKERLGWGSNRAMTALSAWRSRSSGTPRERGTDDRNGVPRSSPPMWGTQERLPDVAQRSCPACRFPLDEALAAAGATHHPTCLPADPTEEEAE